ncbi:hypothetical protein [Streptomyces sp. NPDC001137]|uniref:HEAT repeat domain-containing protein n=1 Tax=Streptomyces sp. NPDC001137 TaxID=3154378 RepID=UPI003327BB66
MSDAVDALVRNLADDDHSVRKAAERRLVALGVQAVDSLLPYVGEDGPSRLKWGAESVLQGLGDQVLPHLRKIRLQGPGRLRSNALKILVDLGGGEYLDQGDRSAVERLVRIKLTDERPVRVPSEAGRWLAFPADQLDAAVSALGLHDLRAVTTVMGVAAATFAKDHIEFETAEGHRVTPYRVFITPEFNGWRLLFGNTFLDELGGARLAEKVSEQSGEAHFYAIDTYHNANLWWIARDGHVVRGHSTYGEPEWVGDPLPFEIEYMEGEDDPFMAPYFVEKYAEGVTDSDVVADALSVTPGPMPESTTHGHGWLATTHPDVPNSRFKGALPI